MCNKNSRAPLLANQRNHNSHTHTQGQLRSTKDPLTALAIGVSSSVDLSVRGTRKSRGPTQNNNRSTLCKWVELREECAALCQYSCLLPCRFNRIPRVSPFDIRRPIRNGVTKWSRPNRPLLLIFAVLRESNCRAPNTNTISNERRLRTQMHQDPLTALAIGVSSSVDLSVGEQERAEAAPKETSGRAEDCAALINYLPILP